MTAFAPESVPNLHPSPLLAALPLGALVLDQQRMVMEVNPALLALLGYRSEQVSDKTLDALVLDANLAELIDSAIGEPSNPAPTRIRFARADGGSLSATISVSRILDSRLGTPEFLVLILDHATDESAAPSSLTADDALSFARVADWELEMATGRIHASHNWSDIWGMAPAQEATLQGILQRIFPLDRESLINGIRQTTETGEPFRARFRIHLQDGEARWLEMTGRLDRNPHGSADERIQGVIMDITERQDQEQTLARYADIVSAIPDRIAYLDRGCRLLAANSAFLRAARRSSETAIGRALEDVCGDGPLTALIQRNLARCLDQGDTLVEDIQEPGRDARPGDAEVRLFPRRDPEGQVTGIVVNIRDVTQIRETERRLLQSAAVYASTSEGVVITDAEGTIIAVNSAFSQITGYTESEVIGNKPNLLNSHWHPKRFFVAMWRRLLRHGSWQGEIWNRRKDGEIYRQRLTIRGVKDAQGRLLNFVGVFSDRSATPDTPQRAEHLIHYDALTKLPNRLLFESRLEHALELGRGKGHRIVALLLNLDRFSNINASLKHHIGDELLRAVATRLREAIRPTDTLARLHADQFGLIIEELAASNEIAEVARRLQSALRAAFWVEGHEVFVTVSIGIASNEDSDMDCGTLLARAESALRLVKRQGRNGYRIATSEPKEPSNDQQRMIQTLRTAMHNKEFQVLYRLGFDLLDKRCVAIQAGLYWVQQEGGLVAPERFLNLANDPGIALELGLMTLSTACRQLQSWLSQGLLVSSLSVSVSESLIPRGDLVSTVERLIAENPLTVHRLELEFSESLLFKHREQIADLFVGLNRLGIMTALSEVGAGWTAPAVLQRLPIKTLAIHPDFIECLADSVHDQAVVQAIINMAQALNLATRADGVRSDKQFNLLSTMGCDQAIGDLWGEPRGPADIQSLLEPSQRTAHPRTYPN